MRSATLALIAGTALAPASASAGTVTVTLPRPAVAEYKACAPIAVWALDSLPSEGVMASLNDLRDAVLDNTLVPFAAAGVVAGVGPDEQVGVPGEVDPGEEGLEVGGGQLAGAATAPGVRRHPDHAVTSRSWLR